MPNFAVACSVEGKEKADSILKTYQDALGGKQEDALMRIMELANSEFIRGTHPELEKNLRAVDATISTLIKQINQLEGDLGLRLFNRSHRGLTMTKAGESLYKDAKYIIGYCHNAIERARNAELNENQIIRIGTSPIMPATTTTRVWEAIP